VSLPGIETKPSCQKTRDAALIIAGNWPALMAMCSPADLRPIQVRGAKERRLAG